ncbi:GNAT family N-acetyltransferase [Actinokineospora enzanensis]|uniref:GNAT family N-acetyltransferase n=1 Tax=Actinokineospora enzanensis TaxID=155975 RepID=UPI00035E590C|nr:GNAT family N-acetyltransferase [Actinokineospora enzanensis]
MTDPVIRPLTAGEEHLFDTFPDPGLVGRPLLGTTYAELRDRGEYRPEWTWIARRGDEVVARAAWWGAADDKEPVALDWLDFTDPDAAAALLRAAPFRVEYCLTLPTGWRDTPAVLAAAQARLTAATTAGMTLLVERYRYRWTPDLGLPERPGRLVYREADDEAFLAVFRRLLAGTLDAHARKAAAESGVDAAAREDLDILLWMPAPRSWWRLAYTPDGDLVGLTVPTRNHANPVIGYIGVVPEHRGRGYAYDLLAEATHILVENGADRIVANTDVDNTPMAATFAKAGYPITQHRIDLTW